MLTAHGRARAAARTGYALSESIYVRGVYQVRKPDGTVYRIDAADGKNPFCNCPARVVCKHIVLFEIARRWWLAAERKAVPEKSVRKRGHFSRRHIEGLRKFAILRYGSQRTLAIVVE